MTTGPEAELPGLWAKLSHRQVLELAVPGAVIGLLTGVLAGVVALAVGTSPAIAVVATLSLGIPLAIAGLIHDVLATSGRMPIGNLAPMAIFWAIGFPVARIINAIIVSLVAGDAVAVPHGWLDYFVYNMLLSTGFSIGFWWLHQNYAARWWYRLRDTNPVAGHLLSQQLRFMSWQNEQRLAKREERKDRVAARRARLTGRGKPDKVTADGRSGDSGVA